MGIPKRNPKTPFVTKELLAWMREKFPDKAPNRNTADRDVWIQVGSVEVIRYLQKLYDSQESG